MLRDGTICTPVPAQAGTLAARSALDSLHSCCPGDCFQTGAAPEV